MVFPTGLSRRRLILAGFIAAGMQTGILASMIREGSGILSEGRQITLRTVPVDPRDLFRGEYVVLNYEFSALDSNLVMGDWPAISGNQTLYIRLEKQADDTWHPVEASFQPLPDDPETVVIRSLPFRYEPTSDKPSTIRAEYGLERYYVPEGQGKELENARNADRVLVDVRVMPDGTARVAALHVEPAAPASPS